MKHLIRIMVAVCSLAFVSTSRGQAEGIRLLSGLGAEEAFSESVAETDDLAFSTPHETEVAQTAATDSNSSNQPGVITDLAKSPAVGGGSSSDLSAKVNNGGLQFETKKKDFRFHVGALIQQDYAFFNQDSALTAPPGGGPGPSGGIGDLDDAIFFRRGRIRFDGVAYEVYEWDFDCELLANNNVAFDDLWVGATQLPVVGNVRVGHVKLPMGIESMTSNRVFTFVERAALFDAFLPEYGPGLLTFDSYQDGRLTWAACAHRLDPLGNGTDSGDGGWNGTFRLASLVFNSPDDRQYLHLGTAYSFRDDRNGSVRFRARPEYRDTTTVASLNSRFVDTGDIAASDYNLFQGEVAWVNGAFSAQTEYLFASVNTSSGAETFNGGYAMASYFLTGESRPYDKRMGRFARLKPIENFSLRRSISGSRWSADAIGSGAWEVAARYSWVDATSSNVPGGMQESFTAGVNWYWNYNFRLQWNYIHTLRNADNPASISGDVDAFIMRMSFDI